MNHRTAPGSNPATRDVRLAAECVAAPTDTRSSS